MGNSNVTNITQNTTVVGNDNKTGTGDQSTGGTDQTSSNTVTPIPALAGPGKLPKKGPRVTDDSQKKLIDSLGGDDFLNADEEDQDQIAPFTDLINKIGDDDENGEEMLGLAAMAWGTCAKKYGNKSGSGGKKSTDSIKTTKKSSYGSDDKEDNEEEDSGYSSGDSSGDMFSDFVSILKEKADGAVHDQLIKYADETHTSWTSDKKVFTSNIKSQIEWVNGKKQPDQDACDALEECEDSDHEDDKSAAQSEGKGRKRKGKLSGLRNLAAKCKGSYKGKGKGGNSKGYGKDEDSKAYGKDDKSKGYGKNDDEEGDTNYGSGKSKDLPVGKGKKAAYGAGEEHGEDGNEEEGAYGEEEEEDEEGEEDEEVEEDKEGEEDEEGEDDKEDEGEEGEDDKEDEGEEGGEDEEEEGGDEEEEEGGEEGEGAETGYGSGKKSSY
jgi:hypothetical protein